MTHVTGPGGAKGAARLVVAGILEAMASSLTGDPLGAVLNPRQQASFRLVAGVGDAPLEVNVTGWNKLVVLDAKRAFLFPRQANNLEWFERELSVYRAFGGTALTVVPRLVNRWQDESVYPFPFAAVTRLAGTHPADGGELLGALGGAMAEWHGMEPPALEGARPPAHHERPDLRWLRRALDPATSSDAVAEAADRLGRSERRAEWTDRLAVACSHPPVFVHGDIHEDQLLAVGDQLTGVLDWETARIDHPFWDFDFGEWGTGLWRAHRSDFSRLWRVAWSSYATARGLGADSAPLETAFRLRHALALLDSDGDTTVSGTIAEHLAAI